MVWVYDSPFTTREQKVYSVLKKELEAKDVAKLTVKIMSLYAFLKSKQFSTPKEIRQSAFMDTSKKILVFTEEQAKDVLKALKKKGGSTKYPFTNHLAKQSIGYVASFFPDSVTGAVRSVYDLATSPVRIVKENVPFGDLLIGMLHGATETGVTTAADVAEGVGGPVGAAAVAIPAAIAAGLASMVSLGEQDFGQAVAHVSNAVPVMGSAIGKGLTQMEHQIENLKKDPRGREVAAYVPFVSEYVTGQPTKNLSEVTNILSLDNLQAQAKARATAELQKRGLPTSAAELQEQARLRGMAELQKRGLPTSTVDLQSRGLSELSKRLPTLPATAAPAAGGKRFSTQRRKYSKWQKTRRNKSGKV